MQRSGLFFWADAHADADILRLFVERTSDVSHWLWLGEEKAQRRGLGPYLPPQNGTKLGDHNNRFLEQATLCIVPPNPITLKGQLHNSARPSVNSVFFLLTMQSWV